MFKLAYLVITLMTLSIGAICQSKIYKKGIDSFNNGNYKLADSLFSIDIEFKPSYESYYARGNSRLHLKDTIGCCRDLEEANYIFVEEKAVKLYQSVCYNYIDTFYFDEKYNQTLKGQHRFYEVVANKKYSTQTIGEVHDVKLKSGGFEFSPLAQINANRNKGSNVIAVYSLEEGIKIFYVTKDQPLGYENVENEANEKRVTNYLYMKYKWFLDKNNLSRIDVGYTYIIEPSGKVERIAFSDVFPDVNISEIKDSLMKDVKDLLSQMKYNAGSFNGNKVPFYKRYVLNIIKI